MFTENLMIFQAMLKSTYDLKFFDTPLHGIGLQSHFQVHPDIGRIQVEHLYTIMDLIARNSTVAYTSFYQSIFTSM